jgi:hypothetical protein
MILVFATISTSSIGEHRYTQSVRRDVGRNRCGSMLFSRLFEVKLFDRLLSRQCR